MSIGPLEFPTIGSSPTDLGLGSLGGASGATGPPGTAATTGPSSDFGDLLVKGIDGLEGMTDKAADLSVKAATGDLTSIHDYTIAASEAQLATQLTVAVRDKAVAAFQQIMSMQV